LAPAPCRTRSSGGTLVGEAETVFCTSLHSFKNKEKVMSEKCGCSCGDKPQGLELAKGYDLACLVEYAEGSVVSRTLQEACGGTLTVFAFSDGQGLSEHSAPFDAVVQILDGTAEIIIGGVPNEVTKGQIIIMPADVPHALRAVTPFKMLLTMIRKG
jgi:quercetin dioxygenase-like cupin family protein